MNNSCCHNEHLHDDGHGHEKSGRDWMIIICTPLIVVPYLLYLADLDFVERIGFLETYVHSIHEFVNASWWGVIIGIIFLALLSRIPREFVMSVLGHKKGPGGIARAMAAGVLLDLCSHGILMVGTKIYQRGASIGQVMAFLIASPWNSISLTFILIAMIGLKLTLLFLVLSAVIAFISGIIFDYLASRGVLQQNPNTFDMPEDFDFIPEAKKQLSSVQWTPALFKEIGRAHV